MEASFLKYNAHKGHIRYTIIHIIIKLPIVPALTENPIIVTFKTVFDCEN